MKFGLLTVKFDLENQHTSIPKTIGILTEVYRTLTEVFYTSGLYLVIIA